jgi:hypothetical protein
MQHEALVAMTTSASAATARGTSSGVDTLLSVTVREDRRGAAARPDADGRTNATTSEAVPERPAVLQWPRRSARDVGSAPRASRRA